MKTHYPPFFSMFEDQLRSISADSAGVNNGWIRMEKKLEQPVDIMNWISSVNATKQIYFRDKEHLDEFGGIGCARTITGTSDNISESLKALWQVDERIRIFGGMSFFKEDPSSPEWNGFGSFRFTVPFIEISHFNSKTSVIVNYYRGSSQNAVKALSRQLKSVDEMIYSSTSEYKKDDVPTEQLIPERVQWNQIIERALHKLHSTEIQKIVLSRKKVLTKESFWNPFDILKQLQEIKETSFLFLYKISDSKAFLGLSPERLLKVKNGCFSVDAVAGTKPRGIDRDDDKRLEDELLNSPKEIEEHRIVAQYIKKKMSRFSNTINTEILEDVLKLANLQHLMTKYSGTYAGQKNPFEILLSFHPTPAVGGYPVSETLHLIQSFEPFERGWYAGPVGWMSKKEADLAVGIRSALVNGKALHIFAGAGIVSRSDVDAEWKETEYKMNNFACISGSNTSITSHKFDGKEKSSSSRQANHGE